MSLKTAPDDRNFQPLGGRQIGFEDELLPYRAQRQTGLHRYQHVIAALGFRLGQFGRRNGNDLHVEQRGRVAVGTKSKI